MAIGTAAAIGLGVAGIGSALGASAKGKAAGKVADGELATAQENNAFAQNMYDQNKGILSPFVNNGTTAGNYLNAFLGLPGSSTNGAFDASSYLSANPDVLTGYNTTADKARFSSPQEYAKWHYDNYGQGENRLGGITPAVTQGQAQNAFGDYIKGSDYGFQFATGANQLNSGYAGSGSLQSGAAMKGLEQYRQNLQSGYRNEYTGLLSGQQATGLAAGSALAGVGQNLTGTVTANNSNAANAASNAALIKGQNNPWANALGTIGGSLLGLKG